MAPVARITDVDSKVSVASPTTTRSKLSNLEWDQVHQSCHEHDAPAIRCGRNPRPPECDEAPRSWPVDQVRGRAYEPPRQGAAWGGSASQAW